MVQDFSEDPIRECVRGLAASWGSSYLLGGDRSWWYFDPATDRPFPAQGWKLHVSAVPVSALRTLRGVAEILMPRGARWKVARSVDHLMRLCTPPAPISQVGKFITVYTEDDAAGLAAELHEATRLDVGPVVPSDRRLRRGSNVYFRYGSFAPRGSYEGPSQTREWIIIDPAGRRVEDRRAPGRHAPPWAAAPPLPDVPERRDQGSGLFGRGIAIREVLHQSAKGGVYLADLDGSQVVVKEARIGTAADLTGRDARSRLLNEWKVLQVLKGSGLAPEPVEFFFEEDNAYLVEEHLPGTTLRQWVETMNYRGQPEVDTSALVRKIRELVARVTAHGVEPRDLTPNNIMVDGDRVAVIDLELFRASRSTEPPFAGATPGYVPYRDTGNSFDVEYALTAIAHFVLTGADPYLDGATDFAPHVPAVLAAFGPSAAVAATAESELGREEVLAEAVAAGEELVRRVEWDSGPWPWPGAWAPGSVHPASFMSGTTGIVRYYLDLGRATGDPRWAGHADELLEWSFAAHPFIPRQSPAGLYFGLGAMPWLMVELAAATGGRRATRWSRRARDLAAELAAAGTEGPDITHGWAGVGLTLLAVWRSTGDEACRAALAQIADRLLRDVQDDAGLPAWPQGGRSYHGFGHGSAGVGYFLLAAGTALGDERAVDLAVTTGLALVEAGVPVADGRGLSWTHHPSYTGTPWTHWCNGASGVGTFLLALESATGAAEFGDAAVRAGRAISLGRPFGSCCRCHGLAGDGDYLLQLADRRGEEFSAAAAHIGRKLDALKIHRGFAVKWAHEGDGQPRPGYMRGYTGIHAFRLRLAGLVTGTPLTAPPPSDEGTR
ncbi:lanthionine synthetase LanC family protein [Lentzea sp. HUAS TT2]|uniref:class III lanthionine synthetase LanKC N-terminal domain-containing protein n=1 Tax=Lentzea sp. HUAS TT2 TaxID=3447454 RepID=UPI003F707E57